MPFFISLSVSSLDTEQHQHTMNGSVIVSTKSCSTAPAQPVSSQNHPHTPSNGNSTMANGCGRVGITAATAAAANGSPERHRSSLGSSQSLSSSNGRVLPAQQTRDPPVDEGYDVTRMREEEFERLAVYIVPDVACERGIPNRADKTLPRSLTLKPSLVLSTPNATVSTRVEKVIRILFLYWLILGLFTPYRLRVCGVQELFRGERDSVRLKVSRHPTFLPINDRGNTFGG